MSSVIHLKLHEEELAFISCDYRFKIKHEESPIHTFYVSNREEFPSVAEKALIILIQSLTSHLC